MPTAWCFFIADTVTNRKVSLRSSSSSDSTALSRISDPLTGQIPPTVWTYFAELQASQPSPSTLINLGQGYPDSSPPQFALESLASAVSDATTSHLHQYTRSSGHPFLVKTLASRYSTHFNRFVDPMKEVVVTVGASQALFVSLQSLVKEGDEVVVFSPYFDLYINQIKLAGGVPVLCDLCYDKEEKIWDFDKSNFERCLTPKTSVVVLNSPHNPTGKTFSRVEMEVIASSIEAHKDSHIRVLSDEVYKFIIHKGEQHTHFATIPSMSERTITISSAGKTFSATGWQVGWAVGEPHLIQGMQSLMPYVQFCASTVVQEGVGRSIIRAGEREGEYYESLRNDYKRKRDVIIAGLRAANENYASGSDDIFRLPSFDDSNAKLNAGGFFLFVELGPALRTFISNHPIFGPQINSACPSCSGGMKTIDFITSEWLLKEMRIVTIPGSAFMAPSQKGDSEAAAFVRVAFCKGDEMISRARDALAEVGQVVKNTNYVVAGGERFVK